MRGEKPCLLNLNALSSPLVVGARARVENDSKSQSVGNPTPLAYPRTMKRERRQKERERRDEREIEREAREKREARRDIDVVCE